MILIPWGYQIDEEVAKVYIYTLCQLGNLRTNFLLRLLGHNSEEQGRRDKW